MKVPALDLQAQYAAIKPSIDDAVARVLESGRFILGPEVTRCEEEIAAFTHSAYACGVSSGTDALLISLLAEGIGRGDEVITTPFTFVATAEAIVRSGATPVFADIDPQSFTLDPQEVGKAMTSRTKAIIPVHLYGQMADMPRLLGVAETRRIPVIEDAAQAMGAMLGGKVAGTIGAYGCLSFFPSKNLGCAGDGGMVLTQDMKRVERLRALRVHGMPDHRTALLHGGNWRLDSMQAAILTAKLPHLTKWNLARFVRAERYYELLASSEQIVLPSRLPGEHAWNQFVIRVPNRDAVHAYMQEQGIDCRIYYPVPLHLQPVFASLGYKEGDFPHAEKAAQQVLSLPLYPEMTDEQQEYIVQTLLNFKW